MEIRERRWDWIDPRKTMEMSAGEVRELREWMERRLPPAQPGARIIVRTRLDVEHGIND